MLSCLEFQGAKMSSEHNPHKSVRELHFEHFVLDYYVVFSGMLFIGYLLCYLLILGNCVRYKVFVSKRLIN